MDRLCRLTTNLENKIFQNTFKSADDKDKDTEVVQFFETAIFTATATKKHI